jgi:hypothetical protein
MADVNKGRVRLLVAALRSGLYIKGTGFLHREPGIPQDNGAFPGFWCCLGVAGDVAHRFGLPVAREVRGHCEHIGGSPAYLSPSVSDWYGFATMDPVLLQADGGRILASEWNDRPDSTQQEIADGFERTFLA